MNKELIVLVSLWLAAIGMLIWKTPRHMYREMHLIFLFTQAIGWIYVFIQSKLKNIEFPYREFPYATDMLFSLHYIIYPTINVFYIIWIPSNKGKIIIVLYTGIFIVLHQLFEFLLERNTDLIENIDWHWYDGILTKLIIYLFILWFYKWYRRGMRRNPSSAKGKEIAESNGNCR
jgi:hypothetical protein